MSEWPNNPCSRDGIWGGVIVPLPPTVLIESAIAENTDGNVAYGVVAVSDDPNASRILCGICIGVMVVSVPSISLIASAMPLNMSDTEFDMLNPRCYLPS